MTNEDRFAIALEMQALLRLCKDRHEADSAGKVTTCCFCACGSAMGGPAGSDQCRALRRLKSILERSLPKAKKKPTELQQEIEEVFQWL